MEGKPVKKGLKPPEADPRKNAHFLRDKGKAKAYNPDRQGKERDHIGKIFPPEENPRIGGLPDAPPPHSQHAATGNFARNGRGAHLSFLPAKTK
jgi:hypothetical protein